MLDLATAMVGPRQWIGGIFGMKRSASNKYIDFKYTNDQVYQEFIKIRKF